MHEPERGVTAPRRVVVFGAGRVAGPLVGYLLRDSELRLTVASAIPGEASALCDRYKDAARPAESCTVNVVDEPGAVDTLIANADCVVALVPEPAQLRVAQACVRAAKPLVTASYPSQGLKELDAAAKAAGVPILCEMGLDPGMDHMIAMKLIDRIKHRNGKVVAFSSVCGGLPAPDAANNPIKYKFSWSPLGALRAAQRPAQYLDEGTVVTIPGQDILSHARDVGLFPAYELEQIPNGDSLPYATHYQIPEVRSIFRGTLRFKGFCSVIGECVALGLLDEAEIVHKGTPWVELLATKLVSAKEVGGMTKVFLHWLGLDSPTATVHATQPLMNAFTEVLLYKLSFASDERDLVLMQVGVEAEFPDGSRECQEALLEEFGQSSGDTAMAKTVGLTAAIGVKLILNGQVNAVGVVPPTLEEIYTPALELLMREGISFKERCTHLGHKPRL